MAEKAKETREASPEEVNVAEDHQAEVETNRKQAEVNYTEHSGKAPNVMTHEEYFKQFHPVKAYWDSEDYPSGDPETEKE